MVWCIYNRSNPCMLIVHIFFHLNNIGFCMLVQLLTFVCNCWHFLTFVRHSWCTLHSGVLGTHPALFACFIAHWSVSQHGISQCYSFLLGHPGQWKCSHHIFNVPSKKCLDMHAETMGHNGNAYSWTQHVTIWPCGLGSLGIRASTLAVCTSRHDSVYWLTVHCKYIEKMFQEKRAYLLKG